jgi:hypothetical protein
MLWLAEHPEAILALFAAIAGGWVGLNRRQARQLKECRERCRRQVLRLKRLDRDYTEALEFNFQDRSTIRKLAVMVRDFRKRLGEPEIDLLLTLYEDADAEMKARRLSAQHESIHRTFPADEIDDLDLTE